MTLCRTFVLLLCLLLTLPAPAQELTRGEDRIDVPAIGEGLWVSNTFQSNMVLQRGKPIHVWGWAGPGETVTVSFAGKTAKATADHKRYWNVELPALPANKSPQAMTIKGKSKTVTLENILVGDVWVMGGQSNMEHPIRAVENGGLEIISANYPEVRVLTIPWNDRTNPVAGFARQHQWIPFFRRHFRKGDWDTCTPQTIREFSAIGYAFARRMHKAADVPIGVIDVSRGGTSVDSWTPIDTLRGMDKPWIKQHLARWDQKVAQFDPQQDLEQRIAATKNRIERFEQEGRPLTDADRVLPSELSLGPIADANYPGGNYHGMLKTIAGLSIKGVVWHQGYNQSVPDLHGPWMHREVLPVMIKSWRKAFNDPQLPFCIISLCTDGEPQTLENYSEKMIDLGIEVREGHYQTFLDLYNAGDKHIGFVSSYDLRRAWYHPQVKIPAGERAARWALATQYGFSEREVPWKPPVITGMTIEGGSILLAFDVQVGDQQRGEMVGFAIAGKDRRFYPAKAEYPEAGRDARNRPRYDKQTVKLTSEMVPDPVAYRYAWGRNPLANVQAEGNKDLPLATQRSDDWPVRTVPLGVLAEDAALPLSRPEINTLRQALRGLDRQRRLTEAQRLIQTLGQE